MAPNRIGSQRSLLQRRKSLTTTFQALMDGLVVLATVYYALYNAQGFISTLDAVFMITLLAVMGVTYDQMGIYRQFGGLIGAARKLFFAWSASFAITLFIFIMAQYFDQFSRPVLSAVFFIAFAGQLANRWILITLRMQTVLANEDRNNALLVGGGPLVKHLYDNINGNPWIQERVIGRIRTHSDSGDEEMPVPILGNRDDIIDVVRDNNVRTVYIAVSLENSGLVEQIYLDLANENIDIHWVPNIFSLDLINHSVKEMAGLPLLTLSESPLIGNHLMFKAIEDRVLAMIALILLSPVMILTAILIKLDSRGPIIFRQSRTGWNGREFHIWKFRSMKLHQAEPGLKQATRDDDRITRVGRFIRKTSIDELPQLFNVLSGTMSLVGPRPHAIEHNSDYDKRIRSYMTRHRIKPGITGLAQIKGYRGETASLEKMKKRVEYDMQYINNWSFWLDLEIIAKTIPALLRDEAY
jgi:putative colanic acid biosynthesis UDP-glucose lipid carrier transferase